MFSTVNDTEVVVAHWFRTIPLINGSGAPEKNPGYDFSESSGIVKTKFHMLAKNKNIVTNPACMKVQHNILKNYAKPAYPYLVSLVGYDQSLILRENRRPVPSCGT